MTTETTKNRIMQFFANQFETRERENGQTFVCLGENRPEWCQNVARESHGDMMPDDYRYKWISHGAETLADIPADEWEERIHEIADGMVDVYNFNLLEWVSSNLSRAEWVNDAVHNGLVDVSGDFDLYRAIMAGQYEEIRETLVTLVEEIESLADDVEPFSAGFNMCGYMPDSEPVTFPDFESAREYIAGEIEEIADDLYSLEIADDEEIADELMKAKEQVEKEQKPFSVIVRNRCFWVAENPEWLNDL